MFFYSFFGWEDRVVFFDMEKIVSDMKVAEWKRSSLYKAHERLHMEASSFLLLSLQWKDLEMHFDSTRDMIQTEYEELERREKAIKLKEEQLEDVEKSIDACSKEIELKKNELFELNRLIVKCDDAIRLKESELDLAQERLGGLSKDIELKEDTVNKVCTRILDVKKEFDDKEKAFDMIRKRIDDCEYVMELKEQKLNGILQLIEERSIECDFKGKSVEMIKELLQEHEKELATKKKQYDAIQMAIKESDVELKLKEKELQTIQNMIATKWKEKRLDKMEKAIKLRTEEIELKEKEFGVMESKLKPLSEELISKESELESIKTCIKEHSKELDVQEKQLDSTQQSIQDCQNAVILLTNYASAIVKEIIQCSKEWELKENHLDPLQESMDDYSNNEFPPVMKEHDSISLIVDKCLEGLKAQKGHFNLLRKSIEERSKNLKNEENNFEKRLEELNKKDEKVSTYLKEIEYLKADLASQVALLDKGGEGRLKEIQHKGLGEKLDSKEKDISLVRDLMETCNEKVRLVKKEESGCIPTASSNMLNFHTGSALDGTLLLVLLCEHLKLHDLVRTELIITLKTSSDPAKLVLDALRWFYSPHTVSEDAKIDFHNAKRGCIFLSELLLKFSPQITAPLKEEALKLAGQWKAKMSMAVDNHVEVVAFLLLVANFQLASDFDAAELQILLNSVSQYKQALELARALGIGDKSSEGRATPSSAKPEQPESLPAKEVELSSLKNEQLSMDPNEERLYLLLNNQLTRQKLVPSAILLFLEKSSDPAKLVLDLIKGYVHQQLNKEQIGFEESFLRWSTLLLKQLKQISPSIGPKEREDAMKLAIDLKLNMRNDTNGSMDAVVFLLLIVSYGLTTSFSGDEILKLFENVVLHEQASELCLMFGYNQKIQELVQNLIGTKQFVRAVRFICGYKLASFRPVQILNEYLRDARNATVKAIIQDNTGQEDVRAAMVEAIDKEIDAVNSVVTCVADCNLGSEISSQGLESLVVSLKDMKRLIRNSHGQPISLTDQQPHSIVVQPQSPPRANCEVQRTYPTKGEMKQQLNWDKSEAQKLRSNHEAWQHHSPPTHQPHQQHSPPTHQPHQQHSPPTHQPHQQHSPPTHQPHQQHSPPTHQPHQQHSPPTHQPHQQHSPPTHQPHQQHSPPTHQPHQQHSPPTHQPHQQHSPPTHQPHQQHSPPTHQPHQQHSPPTHQPHQQHSPPTHQPHQQHSPPTHQPHQQHSPPTHQPHQQHSPPTHQPHQQHSPPTHQPHQQHSPPTHQPHQQQYPSNNSTLQQLQKKRKSIQYKNHSMKYPRKRPSTGPVFTSSSPRVHDKKSKFQRYNSRFSAMPRLFGFREGGRATELGNRTTSPTRSRP
ncbi:uncharacterized protein LOC111439474 isoform X2 [Cucurbita moschata]|uniref:Uncharacterized protein LOC111439474 isoform X2 n=1 Tax=Cucurbita moschata TaxID=3662 RepID=A0A6J1EYC4_CUCMO|nr:uncharacterized protein LOC111439474 isoform X2 [Cucurbita moschata]